MCVCVCIDLDIYISRNRIAGSYTTLCYIQWTKITVRISLKLITISKLLDPRVLIKFAESFEKERAVWIDGDKGNPWQIFCGLEKEWGHSRWVKGRHNTHGKEWAWCLSRLTKEKLIFSGKLGKYDYRTPMGSKVTGRRLYIDLKHKN